MKRFLPSPLLSVAVLVLWLLLAGDISAGSLLIAVVLAIVLPLCAGLLQPEHARLHRLSAILKLSGRVLRDIIASSIEVARQILGSEARIHPGFVWVPLDIRDLHGITALASIISLTPGTLSVELTDSRRFLLVHCFDLKDGEGTIAGIKSRYESLLMEILE